MSGAMMTLLIASFGVATSFTFGQPAALAARRHIWALEASVVKAGDTRPLIDSHEAGLDDALTQTSEPRKQFLFDFGAGKTDGDAEQRALLGGKGANLAEMAKIGLPVSSQHRPDGLPP